MSTKKRTHILIDGSNFYHRLNELGVRSQLEFDFGGFVKYLAGKDRLARATYYVGRIKTEKGNAKSFKLLANQNRLVSHLRKFNIKISLGYLLKIGSGYHEKGVDVQIATDLLINSFKDKLDIAYVVSSDSDLIPAISASLSQKKKIVYVGFKHKPSYALLRTCKNSILLEKSDLIPFQK